MTVFDAKIAGRYDAWFETPRGRYMDAREKALMKNLLLPGEGDRVLDVGCGTGNHLLFFHGMGCQVTGVEPSAAMLDIARRKLEGKADLRIGIAEDLPFSDNEFDIVVLVTSLEFALDAEKAVREAVRVSRGRVFLGVLNKYSIIGTRRRFAGFFKDTLYRHARFFSVWEQHAMVRGIIGPEHIDWGSVIFLPGFLYPGAGGLEEKIPALKNPFGAFIGMAFPAVYRYRTVQDIIKDPFHIRLKGRQEVQGTVREATFWCSEK